LAFRATAVTIFVIAIVAREFEKHSVSTYFLAAVIEKVAMAAITDTVEVLKDHTGIASIAKYRVVSSKINCYTPKRSF